jgi:hypothetical protein
VCVAALAASAGCRLLEPEPSSLNASAATLPGQSTAVYTTMRPTMGAALNDFLNRRPEPTQPIDFPHNIHVGKEIACEIATDRPRIQQITKMNEMGIDLAWQRVYGFSNDDNVKFNHAPHIRAKVECASCHGNVGQMTVAERAVDHTMGFCVNCHNERKAPVDCLTCHF